MAEAQFQDFSGDAAGQFYRGLDAGQTFMQRRQRMQWESEDRSRLEQARALAEPVQRAQMEAQRASAMATLATAKQQMDLKTRFANEAPRYNEMYQAAMALPTFAEQQAALARIQPQVAWMGLIPEGKGFVDVVNNSRAMAFQSDLTDKRIHGTLQEVEARNAGDRQEILLRGQQARETASLVGEQQRMTNAERPRATDPAQRDALRIRSLREQAVALQDVDPETSALLFKRADYLANPSAMQGGLGALDSLLGGPAPAPSPVTPAQGPATVAPAPSGQSLFQGIQY